MKTTLTSEQIASYQQDGFVLHRGFLSAEEVAELKEAVVMTVAAMGKKTVAGGGVDMQAGDSYYDKVFTQRLNLWRINDTAKKFMLNSDLGRMLCRLAGVEGFRVWHDQALIKEPYGNPTAWHLDNPYWSFYSKDSISIWIALEDATPENGCMYFVPGTQRLATFDNVGIGNDLGELFRIYPKMREIDPICVPMKAGDCSFHNGLTAHGAGANMTRKRRIAMTCAYMPVGSTFNGQRNILPEAYFKSLQHGEVLANDDWNPVVCLQNAMARA
ncbi:MAG: phytanoyl-CoA dioxygenase family protein [Methylacidiphilales bacterium]|nr:phytanoyl-CoA dioxygenase family protein [Candidatus Methylacidiphilales bacterium]